MRSEPVRDTGPREGERRGPSSAIEGTRSPMCPTSRTFPSGSAAQRPFRCFACASVHLGDGLRTRPPKAFSGSALNVEAGRAGAQVVVSPNGRLNLPFWMPAQTGDGSLVAGPARRSASGSSHPGWWSAVRTPRRSTLVSSSGWSFRARLLPLPAAMSRPVVQSKTSPTLYWRVGEAEGSYSASWRRAWSSSLPCSLCRTGCCPGCRGSRSSPAGRPSAARMPLRRIPGAACSPVRRDSTPRPASAPCPSAMNMTSARGLGRQALGGVVGCRRQDRGVEDHQDPQRGCPLSVRGATAGLQAGVSAQYRTAILCPPTFLAASMISSGR